MNGLTADELLADLFGPRQKTRMTTAEVRELIEAQYGNFPPAEIAAQAGRSVGYIRCMASAMGVKSCGRGPQYSPLWTLQEVRRLKAGYGSVPVSQLAEEMGRTRATIMQKAHRLGLGRRRGRLWTKTEDAIIRDHYATEGRRWCAEKLKRGIDSVVHRARWLGVSAEGRRKLHQWKKTWRKSP